MSPLGQLTIHFSFLAKRRRRQWHPIPVLLPGKSHGRRSLIRCSPWGLWESDMTEQLHFHFPLSCIGEENGNPFQCSCLENPRDRGAWWAAFSGVTQIQTQLKQLSSSNNSEKAFWFPLFPAPSMHHDFDPLLNPYVWLMQTLQVQGGL